MSSAPPPSSSSSLLSVGDASLPDRAPTPAEAEAAMMALQFMDVCLSPFSSAPNTHTHSLSLSLSHVCVSVCPLALPFVLLLLCSCVCVGPPHEDRIRVMYGPALTHRCTLALPFGASFCLCLTLVSVCLFFSVAFCCLSVPFTPETRKKKKTSHLCDVHH